MRRTLGKLSLVLGATVVLAVPQVSWAQLSSSQLEAWLNTPAASSHVGNITGDAKAAAMPYRRYCVGCHGVLGDGNGENAVWLDPKPRHFQLAGFKGRPPPGGTFAPEREP